LLGRSLCRGRGRGPQRPRPYLRALRAADPRGRRGPGAWYPAVRRRHRRQEPHVDRPGAAEQRGPRRHHLRRPRAQPVSERLCLALPPRGRQNVHRQRSRPMPLRAPRAGGGLSLANGTARTFPVAGVCAVPADAAAVAVNITAVSPATAGFVQLYPAGAAVPVASTLNAGAGQTRTNNSILPLGPGGQATARATLTSGTVDLVVDVMGYFR